MRRGMVVLSACVLALMCLALESLDARAQNGSKPAVRRYNGIDAGQEAYLIHENQRRGVISAQMALNDDMLMLRGLPPKYFDYFPANPFNAWPAASLATDAWGTPYYLAPPVAGAPVIQDPGGAWLDLNGAPQAGRKAGDAGRLTAPVPNPPRPANAGNPPPLNRPLLNREGQPIRPEELPAPAEVRQQLSRGGPREF